MTTVAETDRRISGYVWPTWIAATLCLFGAVFGTASAANAETRSLKLYFVHTGEKAEIVFKRNGRFDAAGLRKVNMMLRDWRRNEPTRMDPRLLDIVWEAYRQSGSRAYVHVVSAYRSPATNAMLRSRSRGVAKKSQHMLGKAMDFYLPDVKLKTLRNIGLRLQAGGVGYYPTSGSPFVHFDVGNVRHWPGISRSELASVFPNGKTLHVPSDGKPLPGYEQAMASYKQRVTKGDLAIASLTANSGSSGKKRSGGLLAAWFGGGADEEEDNGESAAPARATPRATVASRPAEARPATATAQAKPAARQPEITILPPELAAPADTRQQPAEEIQPAQESVETPETILAALPARKVPMPAFAPRPEADVGPTAAATEVAALMEDQATALPVGESQLLANAAVPIPAWRPDYKAAPEADDPAALLALASVSPEPAAFAPLPATKPVQVIENLPVADARPAVESLPERRPGTDGSISSDTQIRVASIPEPARKQQRVTPKQATPVVAEAQAVKTTAKAGRVTATSSPRQDAKPVVLAAVPQSARWALDQDYVKKAKGKGSAPSFAQNIVRTAPMEVYTAGFQSSASAADPNRFTGKAVEFLSVARFN